MVLARDQAMHDTHQEHCQQQLSNHTPQVQPFQSPQPQDYPGHFLQPNNKPIISNQTSQLDIDLEMFPHQVVN
jgi:hypothetical protein